MSTSLRAKALACTVLAGAALASAPAFSQVAAPPVRQSVDANGVDLFWGNVAADSPALTLGQGAAGLDYHWLNRGAGWTDNITATIHLSGSTVTINLGDTADRFALSGGAYTPTEGNGATLAYNSSTQVYTYTRADGTVMHFDKHKASATASEGRVTDIAAPPGNKLVFAYDMGIYCKTVSGDTCTLYAAAYRVASIRNSHGYRLSFTYYSDTIDDLQRSPGSWAMLTGVSADNLAGGSTVRSASFDSETYQDSLLVTDAMSRVTRYRSSASAFGITLPGSSSEDVTYTYTSGRVTGVTTPAGTTSYAASDASGVRTVTVTDPLSHATIYAFDIASARITSVTDALSHTTSYQYDTSGRPTRVTAPEGNYVQTTYDGRGNVTESRAVAKSGSGLPDMVTSAVFPSSCTNFVTCNKATSTTDARGNTSEYTYDATHGGVLTFTAPAPTSGANRPQARYGYSQLQAYFNKGSGVVASGEPVWLLSSTSACQTGTSCSGTADEVVTSIGYGPQTTGVGNNLLPVSVSNGAGDASLTASSNMAYDDVGNLTSVDGPLAGSADTTTYRYDADRERVGIVSPDPDGSGALKNRAVRATYNALGQVTKVEQGNVNSQSDSDWAGLTTLQEVDATYDSAHRPVTQRLVAGGTTYALTQTSYDAGGRVDCTATRMNPAAYSSLPTSACSLGTAGSYGNDRIAKVTYDAVNRVTMTTSAYGTAEASNDVSTGYTTNGRVQSVTDAESNKTTYVYDGQDRLYQTQLPSATKGAGTSNSGDYEQLGRDANGNVTTRRLRDGHSIGFTYDALNRMTQKDVPAASSSTNAYSVYYGYDLRGMLAYARFGSATGSGIAFSYDALGRQLTETSNMDGTARSWNSAYDAAGNRTLLTSTNIGSYYQSFSYDVLGERTSMGGSVNTTTWFGYDDLGRRTSLGQGLGSVAAATTYGYDGAGRLTSLAQDLNGTSKDLTLGFSYNPTSQIIQSTRSNDDYAWQRHYNFNRSYTENGLNQYTASGAVTPTYDANGNLTSDGSTTFIYDDENHLVSASGAASASLSYDPLGRLWQVSSSTGTTRFVYDGDRLTAEYDGSGTLVRTYVHGPGTDEPLTLGIPGTTPRFLKKDERGSIVATTDSSGNSVATNTYDEYGIPGSANQGRFGYTGQAWLAELGLWYYKARFYSPTMGRFMRTDPEEYGDGLNTYSYVASDPINRTDPPASPPLTALELI